MKKILAVIALACPLAAHAGIYLKIDAIKGESTNDRHKGEIDISSMQFGIGRTGQTARVCPTEVVMTKAMDSASAPLVAAAMTTTVFPKATIAFTRPGENPVDYFTLELTNVAVFNYTTSSGGDVPSESFALAFQSAVYKFTPQDARGGPGAPLTATITRNGC